MNNSANTQKTSFLQFVAERQELTGKSNEEVAAELKYDDSRIWEMIKSGAIKMPATKLLGIAAAIQCPPYELVRLVLADQMPELLSVIDQVWSPKEISASEKQVLDAFRHLSKGRDAVPHIFDGGSVLALITV
jgi:hypothetical protein